MAALLAVPSVGNAYTVDQIMENGEYLVGTYVNALTGKNWQSDGIRLEKISNTQIRFHGINGIFDFTFDLAYETPSSYVTATEGDLLKIYGDKCADAGNFECYPNTQWFFAPGQSQRLNTYGSMILEIKEDADGKLYFKNRDLCGFVCTAQDYLYSPYNRYWYVANPDRFFKTVEYHTVEWNSDVEDVYNDLKSVVINGGANIDILINTSQPRNYKANVTFDLENKRFSILNMGNNGYCVGGDANRTLGERTGTIDTENKKLIFDTNQYTGWFYGTNAYGGDIYEPTLMQRMVLDSSVESEDVLEGSYEEEGVYHNSAEHGWVSNEGERRTYEGLTLSVEDYTYYADVLFYNKVNFEGLYSDTKIFVGNDVTHQVDMEITDFGYNSEDGILVEGYYVVTENPQHVDHHELYFTPNSIESVKNRSDLCTTHGFTHGININDDSFTYNPKYGENVPASRAATAGKKVYFSKLIPADLVTNGNNYSLYVKAVYDENVNADHPSREPLTETFHALTTKKDATTSIDFNFEENGFNVAVDGLNLYVAGAEGDVEVYATSGMRIYCGADDCIALPASGVYIVRNAGKTAKVVVR